MTTRTNAPAVLGRRAVLGAGAAGAGTVLLGLRLSAPAGAQTAARPDGEATAFDAWIAVRPDDTVVLQVSQAEMGQGVHTTFPAIIAEEMDADWDRTVLELSGHDPAFFNPKFPQQFTGNAESTRTFWPIIRRAGAAAREMLAGAAADRWDMPRAEVTTRASACHHAASGRRAGYGALAAAAAGRPVPEAPRLKDPSEWRLLGRSLPRRDMRDKVTGAPIFGLDATVEGMVHATIRHADTPGGTLSLIERAGVEGMPGVLGVVELPGAVAVVADKTWRALKAAAALDVLFAPGPRDGFSTASLDALYATTMAGTDWTEIEAHGAPVEMPRGEAVFEAEYHSAWQAHAPMEPMNCIADVQGDRARILAPTQGQTMIVVRVAAALGIPEANVTAERTFLGGGFGRRLASDYAEQAALVSRAVGRPVQVVWSREEDIRHDRFRPHTRNRIRVAIDADGLPVAMDHALVSPTIQSSVIAKPVLRFVYPEGDNSVVEGATTEGFLYGVPSLRVRAHILDVPVPTMVWRTTGYGPNVFAVESAVDELAARAEVDPIDYRMALLRRTAGDAETTPERRHGAERGIAVLERLREAVRFGSPEGMAQGVAYSHCFETHIAQVADISVGDDGTLDIHRITTVLDGGHILDPDVVTANIQGGIAWGLSQALTSEVTFEDGRAQQANFDTFEILALPETPPTELHWIESGESPGGLGEVGPVPTAPALANAIAAATGRRLRTLPLSRHGIHTRYRKRFLPPAVDLTRPKA